MSDCHDAAPEALVEGIAYFNRGEFYECHEVLEDLWRAEPDAVRLLYQGIIQIAVAFHHLRRGNQRGAVKLLTAGTEKLRRFQPTCQGVDNATLLAGAERCLGQLRRFGAGRVSEFDWSQVPRIVVARPRD